MSTKTTTILGIDFTKKEMKFLNFFKLEFASYLLIVALVLTPILFLIRKFNDPKRRNIMKNMVYWIPGVILSTIIFVIFGALYLFSKTNNI